MEEIYSKLSMQNKSIIFMNYMFNRQRQQLSEQDILSYMVQILLAMKHIHSKNILHRDLKPQVFLF